MFCKTKVYHNENFTKVLLGYKVNDVIMDKDLCARPCICNQCMAYNLG